MTYLEQLKTMEQELESLKSPLQNMKVLSEEERETIYAAAYGQYENGKYKQAAQLFTHLVMQNPFEARFWQGLASSQQMDHEFQAALHAWSMVCILRNHPADAHFHAAECLLSIGEKEDASKALNLAKKNLDQAGPFFKKIHHLQQRIASDG